MRHSLVTKEIVINFLRNERSVYHLRQFAPGRFTPINPDVGLRDKGQTSREQKTSRDLIAAMDGLVTSSPLSASKVAELEKRGDDILRGPLKKHGKLLSEQKKLEDKRSEVRASIVKKFGVSDRRTPLLRSERAVDPFVVALRNAKSTGAKEVGVFEQTEKDLGLLGVKVQESSVGLDSVYRKLLHDRDVRLVVSVGGELARQHIHDDGSLGGLVGDSARVASSAFIGLDSIVRDGCVVGEHAMIMGSEVSGRFYVQDDVEVHNSVLVSGGSSDVVDGFYTSVDSNVDSEIVRRV